MHKQAYITQLKEPVSPIILNQAQDLVWSGLKNFKKNPLIHSVDIGYCENNFLVDKKIKQNISTFSSIFLSHSQVV